MDGKYISIPKTDLVRRGVVVRNVSSRTLVCNETNPYALDGSEQWEEREVSKEMYIFPDMPHDVFLSESLDGLLITDRNSYQFELLKLLLEKYHIPYAERDQLSSVKYGRL